MATEKSNAQCGGAPGGGDGGSGNSGGSRRERSRAAWRLARRQHGVLTRSDLMALGFGTEAIRHRVRTGRLHRVYRGVYSVGRRELAREGRWMAAVLACAPDAVLSHGSAAALWGIGKEGKRIDVIVRRRARHRRDGVTIRSRPSLPSQDVTTHNRIPVTTPSRTVLDQAATPISDSGLERLVNEASQRDRVHPEPLRRYIDLRPGEPGVVRLRALLDRDTFRLSDSELERRFRPIARAAGLPVPQTKVILNEFEVDFYWPDLSLVVETDSLRYHRTAQKQTRDLLRDQTHTAAGLTPLRFTHWQVRYDPRHVTKVLRATLRLRLHPAGAAGAGSRPS
jgi:very-short-patch-repair endonuclease